MPRCAMDALAMMDRKDFRSKVQNLHGVLVTTVAARGALYNSASSPKDMLEVPDPNTATLLERVGGGGEGLRTCGRWW